MSKFEGRVQSVQLILGDLTGDLAQDEKSLVNAIKILESLREVPSLDREVPTERMHFCGGKIRSYPAAVCASHKAHDPVVRLFATEEELPKLYRFHQNFNALVDQACCPTCTALDRDAPTTCSNGWHVPGKTLNGVSAERIHKVIFDLCSYLSFAYGYMDRSDCAEKVYFRRAVEEGKRLLNDLPL